MKSAKPPETGSHTIDAAPNVPRVGDKARDHFEWSTSEDANPEASPIERLVTHHEIAEIFGLPPWKVQRAGKAGLIPSYTFLNGRRLYKVSEVAAVIDASRTGGADV